MVCALTRFIRKHLILTTARRGDRRVAFPFRRAATSLIRHGRFAPLACRTAAVDRGGFLRQLVGERNQFIVRHQEVLLTSLRREAEVLAR
jgi:hypothetical protein